MVSTATDWEDQAGRKEVKRRLVRAVGQDKALSRAGMGQRFFAYLFKGLVYPQIWEDPDVVSWRRCASNRAIASSPSPRAAAMRCPI